MGLKVYFVFAFAINVLVYLKYIVWVSLAVALVVVTVVIFCMQQYRIEKRCVFKKYFLFF